MVRERSQFPYGGPPESGAGGREEMALALDRAIREVKKADWRGNRFKEREIRNAIRVQLGDDDALGELQHGRTAHLAQSRAGQEAGRVPGVHPRPRNGASHRASPH